MKRNVGGTDRVIRFIAGIVLLALGIFVLSPVAWKVIFIIVGAILFLTALGRFCPINLALGINTCVIKQAADKLTGSKEQSAQENVVDVKH